MAIVRMPRLDVQSDYDSGVQGVIAAPVFYAYLKAELVRRSLV